MPRIKTIGSVNYSGTNNGTKTDTPIKLYEAIQYYSDSKIEDYKRGKGSAHVYILASNKREAREVKEAWLRRNGEKGSRCKSRLIHIMDLHDLAHNASTVDILVAPSLEVEKQVKDYIRLR